MDDFADLASKFAQTKEKLGKEVEIAKGRIDYINNVLKSERKLKAEIERSSLVINANRHLN